VKTLLLVHAHPDDESVATGGVMLRAHQDGHRVVLVTATRGEEGEIHNMDEASARARLAEIRAEELRRSCEILGVDRQVFLGYRDSGMAGTPANQHPESFHVAPLAEVAGRLSVLLREERPEVVVTYTPDGTYGHPDHVKAHDATLAALALLERESWRPAKTYLHAVSRSFVDQVVQGASAAGIQLPEEMRMIAGVPDEEITTVVDVSDVVDRKLAAFTAHLSQIDPDSPVATMGAPILELVFGVEQFVLARGALGEARPERCLFAGV
jgi:LmbE family N-acetylglucosaminyl deacetylase